MTWEIIIMHILQRTNVLKRAWRARTTWEWVNRIFLDELTLVNSHFVTLCDYYGNVHLESMIRAPPWLYKTHPKWEKAIAALCFHRLPCCVKEALELGLIALLIWSACALERLVKVKCKHHLNHLIAFIFE